MAKKDENEKPKVKLRDQLREALTAEIKPTKAQLDAEKGTAKEKEAHACARIRAERVRKLRSDAAVARFEEVKATIGEGIAVPAGRGVYFRSVKAIPDGVELYVDGEDGDPHFRIFNPPTLIEDPTGDIEIQGKRFREDPLGALGEVVANYRQSESKKGRGR